MPEKILCSVVIPVFNEEPVISETYKRLKTVMDSLNEPYELIFVNDGSNDGTAAILADICEKDHRVKLISFSRNFGHQLASTAGMDYACGETVVLIDADLQDPPELIPDMVAKWREGFDVVYGVRVRREGETFFKKATSMLFYRILRNMANVDIPLDTGDFRLIGRNVCDELRRIDEKSRYIRGLISWLGFKQTGIEYVRDRRFAGESKYPLKKMLRFACDGIASFSYKPLKLASWCGGLILATSLFCLLAVLYQELLTGRTVPGWAPFLAIAFFLNGVILVMLGIFGAYLGRIYDEVKGRPLYIVSETRNFSEQVKSMGRILPIDIANGNPINVPGVNPINIPGADPINVLGADPINIPGADPINVLGADPINFPGADPISSFDKKTVNTPDDNQEQVDKTNNQEEIKDRRII